MWWDNLKIQMNFFSSIMLEWKTCPPHTQSSEYTDTPSRRFSQRREDKKLFTKSTSSQVSLRLKHRLQIAHESLSARVCRLDVWESTLCSFSYKNKQGCLDTVPKKQTKKHSKKIKPAVRLIRNWRLWKKKELWCVLVNAEHEQTAKFL